MFRAHPLLIFGIIPMSPSNDTSKIPLHPPPPLNLPYQGILIKKRGDYGPTIVILSYVKRTNQQEKF